MKSYREESLRRAIAAFGITPGALVMVHSSLFSLGRIQGTPIEEIPSRHYWAIRDVLGPQGTIVVPAFNFGFCRGEVFDRQRTPSMGMGSFSEYLRRLPTAIRSPHPIQSLAAEGPLAEAVACRDTPGAFEPGSSFDALLDYDAQILLIGCGVEPVSLVHWAEERVGVPYRHWKEFHGTYRDRGRESRRTYRMYVRDLDLNPHVRLDTVGALLLRRGDLRSAPLGGSSLELCRARDFAAAATTILSRDPTALIKRSTADDSWSPHGIR